MSPEERIRRAEEIYYSRRLRSGNVRMSSSQVTEGTEKRQYSLYRKMAIQILICILIYLVFSLIKDANYFFSDGVIDKTKEILSTDINFEVISSNIGDFFKNNQEKFNFLGGWFDNSSNENNIDNQSDGNDINNQSEENINNQSENQVNTNDDNSNSDNNIEENNSEQSNSSNSEDNQNLEDNQNTQSAQNENEQNSKTDNSTSNNQAVGIGGGSDEEEAVQVASQTSSKKTQMEKDAEYIKANYKMQIPVSGKITSGYGKREPTEIVSENHQGIDIGVVEGTTVVSAMDGKVSLVSSEGSYGIHVKIVKDDITTVYAHCSKILVKEGQTVKKGQKIALSGNTGNTTGPHLHFEIQRSGRTINPELILKWS